jgi:AraC family transcriptional regulator
MSNTKAILAIKEQRRVSPDVFRPWSTATPVSTARKEQAGMPHLRLSRVIAFVESHLADDLCVSTLAMVAGMSPFYFCRSFKQSTGTTPHRYVLSRRMEQAKVLIEKNGVSLLEIAQQLGFADQSQFTRVFHKILGLTPSQYRDALKRSRRE